MSQAPKEQTVAQLTVDALIQNDIKSLYCLPGIQNDLFFDALYHRTDELAPIHTRHEQGAAYMAMGAALATGKPQACCVVPGPGFLNASAALCTAYAVNAPVMALVGQIPAGAVGKGHGLLHEIPDQFSILKGLTKQATQIQNGEGAGASLQQAFSHLLSGRSQPVGVEIPVSAWNQEALDGGTSLVGTPTSNPAVDTDQIAAAATLLLNAKAPMIIVGSGAQAYSESVKLLAQQLNAPVLAFRNGQGVIPSDNPLSISMPVAHDLWPKTDVVIGLGTRLQSQVMAWGNDDNLKIIHIDIDDTQLNRSAKADIGIHASLADALPELLTYVEGQESTPLSGARSSWIDLVTQTKAKRQQQYLDKLGPQMQWLEAIRSELPRDGIFVDELTQTGYVSRFAFPCYEPRTFLSTGYQGTLGYGFATALGAAHARPDVPVVSISGDGGALFAITELATAVRHKISLTTIIFNDNAFGNVKLIQSDSYDNRHIASDLQSPDFVTLAESFGAQGLRATNPAELRIKLQESFKHEGPTIIEVPVGKMPNPWDFILMPKNRGL